MAQLISNITELQQYVKVSNGLQYTTVTPGLNEVELQTLVYYLGQDLLDIIIAEHNVQNFTTRITAIYPYVLQALANLGVYKAVNEIEVQVNDNGITRIESENEKTAFGGQVLRYKETIGNRGYAAVDSFLAVIEADEGTYPEWASSQYYADKDNLLFTGAVDYNRYENIKSSSLTYMALAGYIKDCLTNVEHALPEAMYTDILSAGISAENETLRDKYIKPALAKLSMAKALVELPVMVDHQGVVVNQLQLSGLETRTRTAAPNTFIERKLNGLEKAGYAHLASMTEFLNENASDSAYTDWYGSDFYEESLSSQIKNNETTDDDRNVYRA